MRPLVGLLLLFLLLLPTGPAAAHALQPGYLELTALGGETWRVFWKKPAVAGGPMAIDAILPAQCDRRSSDDARFEGAAFVTQWIANCPGGLAGGEIAIRGLEKTRTDVLVRYELAPGEAHAKRLTSLEPAFLVPEAPGFFELARSYFGLGVEHILEGADHLLFVFGLLLLIRDRWRLVGAITAFTLAHSLTLAAAALGWFVVPAPPVEAVIALSIMFLASELLRRKEGELHFSERYPWSVAFTFGLLHGLGFARALLDVGLPAGDVPLALLTFNLGVEAGQLLFITAVLLLAAPLRWFVPKTFAAAGAPGSLGQLGAGYAIGGVAAFWFVSRIAAF